MLSHPTWLEGNHVTYGSVPLPAGSPTTHWRLELPQLTTDTPVQCTGHHPAATAPSVLRLGFSSGFASCWGR